MAELVIQNSNGNDVTTSLIVAQVFGKNHKDVLRDIEKLSCSEDFRVRNFAHTPYTHPQNGQIYHYYEMTKDGFSFLVMGYTGAKAGEFKEKFISEFNRREMMLKDDDYILMRSQQILQKRVEAAEQRVKALEADNAAKEETIELQQKELAQAAPKNNKFLFGDIESLRIFAVLQIIIYYAQGIFYALKAFILKIYREVISVYHSLWRMIVCSKIGYDFSFFINNK